MKKERHNYPCSVVSRFFVLANSHQMSLHKRAEQERTSLWEMMDQIMCNPSGLAVKDEEMRQRHRNFSTAGATKIYENGVHDKILQWIANNRLP